MTDDGTGKVVRWIVKTVCRCFKAKIEEGGLLNLLFLNETTLVLPSTTVFINENLEETIFMRQFCHLNHSKDVLQSVCSTVQSSSAGSEQEVSSLTHWWRSIRSILRFSILYLEPQTLKWLISCLLLVHLLNILTSVEIFNKLKALHL